MNENKKTGIVIVGGGASGVLLAAQLLKTADPALRVALVEKSGVFGRGLAYSTDLDDHLLNVGARRMSAFHDEPDHFRQWLAGRGVAIGSSSLFFAPRRLYGDYLAEIASRLAQDEPVRLTLLHAEALSVTPAGSGVAVALASGEVLEADAAVLAVGHDTGSASAFPFAVRPGAPADTPLADDASVLILGTGLSMIDTWLALKAQGHRGTVTALSRRGLLPLPHLSARPEPLEGVDAPVGASPARFAQWLRRLVRAHRAAGGDWQNVIDGLRPFNQRIWQAWDIEARRRFLRHAKAWWDVHRHRAAPQIHARLKAALENGDLRLVAGRIEDVIEGDRQAGNAFEVAVRRRGEAGAQRLAVARIYDCTGIVRDLASGSLTVLRSLIERGLARPDPLGLGLDVAQDCAVIDATGAASDRIFALGPLTRGALFEIEAVPDIRVQAALLAERLTGRGAV